MRDVLLNYAQVPRLSPFAPSNHNASPHSLPRDVLLNYAQVPSVGGGFVLVWWLLGPPPT